MRDGRWRTDGDEAAADEVKVPSWLFELRPLEVLALIGGLGFVLYCFVLA